MKNAKWLYSELEVVHNLPSVKSIFYYGPTEGFDVIGDIAEDILVECSAFMEEVVRSAPYHLRFKYFLDSGKMNLDLDNDLLFKHHYALDKNMLFKAMRIPKGKSLPVDDSLCLTIEKAVAEAECKIESIVSQTILDVQKAVLPFGFRVESQKVQNGHILCLESVE